jgi:hypothetical protein
MDIILFILASAMIYSAMYGPTLAAVALKYTIAWLAIVLSFEVLDFDAVCNALFTLVATIFIGKLVRFLLGGSQKLK